MTELITVPTFTFRQGKHIDSSFEENPIQVSYYNGSIVLTQEGEYDQDESITISPKHVNALFRAIKKHLPEAEEKLNSNH